MSHEALVIDGLEYCLNGGSLFRQEPIYLLPARILLAATTLLIVANTGPQDSSYLLPRRSTTLVIVAVTDCLVLRDTVLLEVLQRLLDVKMSKARGCEGSSSIGCTQQS